MVLDLRSRGHRFNPRPSAAVYDSGQVVGTHVPQSPSSVIWYQCKNQGGNDTLWKRCGLPYIAPGTSPVPAQDQRNGDEHCTLASSSLHVQLWSQEG